MDGSGTPAAALAAWRERVRERTVRFHRVEALARRASGHDGELRRLLDARLSALIDAPADADADADAPAVATADALSGLLEHLRTQTARRDEATGRSRPAFPELGVLGEVRAVWSAVRAQSQLRQSLEPASEDTGPLNSSRLVHRAVTLMHELSPGYLQQFLSHVDALTWLEQMKDSGALPAEPAMPAPATHKRAPRKRKA